MKKVILTAIIGFILSGCNPGSSNSNRSAVTRNGIPVSNNQNQTGVITTTCQQGQSTFGTIYEQSYSVQSQQYIQYNSSFEDRVKGLLSVLINPGEVGSISGYDSDTTGVRFQGTIKVDASGNVVPAQTKLYIKVYDSYVLNGALDSNGQKYSPIPISFDGKAGQNVTGQINLQTGVGSIVFSDQYGSIRFDGQYDNSGLFRGTVSYSNTVTVVQGQAPSSGILGQFYIARCAFIQ